MSADIFLTREGAIGRLCLNRPDKRNAITQAMWTAIPGLLAEAAASRDLLVLVVTGQGGCFAAGADIAEFPTVYATPQTSRIYSDAVQAAGRALAAFPKPTLALIRGACVGGGAGLALACDLRFADETARIGVTPAKLGLAYTLADTRRLADAVGLSRAKDILFSGRLVAAQEALEIGLIDVLAPADRLEGAVRAYAEGLAGVSQASLRAMKATLNAIAAGVREETEETYRAYLEGFAGEDFKEGYAAFLAKRPARFTAR